MIVVADSGPLYYLVLLEHIDLLRVLLGPGARLSQRREL